MGHLIISDFSCPLSLKPDVVKGKSFYIYPFSPGKLIGGKRREWIIENAGGKPSNPARIRKTNNWIDKL